MLESIDEYDKLLEQAMNKHPECRKLMALEGVGVINSINPYMALDCGELGTFKTGRDASACIGLTPIQYCSGGQTKLGSIGKFVKNGSTRSCLVSGSMSIVNIAAKREPKAVKEKWLKQLIDRRGKRCVVVALANKTVRTALAMLSKGTEYQAQALTA